MVCLIARCEMQRLKAESRRRSRGSWDSRCATRLRSWICRSRHGSAIRTWQHCAYKMGRLPSAAMVECWYKTESDPETVKIVKFENKSKETKLYSCHYVPQVWASLMLRQQEHMFNHYFPVNMIDCPSTLDIPIWGVSWRHTPACMNEMTGVDLQPRGPPNIMTTTQCEYENSHSPNRLRLVILRWHLGTCCCDFVIC